MTHAAFVRAARWPLRLVCLCLSPGLAVAASAQEAPPPGRDSVIRYTWTAAGEPCTALLWQGEPAQVQAAMAAARAEVERVHLELSLTQEGAQLQRMLAGAGTPQRLSPEVYDFLAEAWRVAELSGGAYDPTAGALRALWQRDEEPRVPGVDVLKAARQELGYGRATRDAAQQTISLPPGVGLDIAELRRGAALERAAAVLAEQGLASFILSCGSDLVARGSKGALPWMVGVQDPRAAGYFAAFPARDVAVATASDAARAHFVEGVRFHDVVDPRTGVPARGVRSATVMAPRAETAAALARAVLVLGADEGMQLVARLERIEALVVDAENKVHVSAGLREQVELRPPTDGP